jgi:hypothetical protein
VHKARQSRTREDNHKQLQTTVVLLIAISWPRGLDLDLDSGLDFGLDSGLEQKHEVLNIIVVRQDHLILEGEV